MPKDLADCTRCKKRPPAPDRKRCAECLAKTSYFARMLQQGSAEYRRKHRDIVRRKRKKDRAAIIALYGSKCACCGEATPEFLTVDHRSRNGAEHRRALGIKPNNMGVFYARLLKEGKRPDIQLLCANCHMAKDMFGGCPHEFRRRIAVALSVAQSAVRTPGRDKGHVISEMIASLSGGT
jgi:hypothetical protein